LTAIALAAWLQALPVRPCSASTARVVARVALRVAPRYRVPVKLLALVACLESRGRKGVVYRNRNGSCDVGRWQVNCHRCSPQCRERYTPDLRSAGRAARILALGWSICKRKGAWYCPKRWWCRFNPGSKRWCTWATLMWRTR